MDHNGKQCHAAWVAKYSVMDVLILCHFNWHDFQLTTTSDHILPMKDETANFKQPSFKLILDTEVQL